MTRLVKGRDGRMWTLRSQMEWSTPVTVDDFEHDVSNGYAPGIVMLAMLCVLVVALVLWTPAGVVIPVWLIVALAAILLFFPVRWALRRPFQLVANTRGDGEDLGAEQWVGTVRGMYHVRAVTAKVARDIEVYNMPSPESQLYPVS